MILADAVVHTCIVGHLALIVAVLCAQGSQIPALEVPEDWPALTVLVEAYRLALLLETVTACVRARDLLMHALLAALNWDAVVVFGAAVANAGLVLLSDG